MTYTEHGDEVVLQMSRDDYNLLLFALGSALESVVNSNEWQRFYVYLDLVNRMNAGNPRFTPYEIPDLPNRGMVS